NRWRVALRRSSGVVRLRCRRPPQGQTEGWKRRSSFVQVSMGICSGAAVSPMPANLDKTQDRKASAGRARCARLNVVAGTPQPEDQAVFTSSDLAKPTFPAATQLDLSTIEGTVGASMTAVEEQSYGSGSGALLSGAPLPRAPQREAAVAPALRANLIAELRE